MLIRTPIPPSASASAFDEALNRRKGSRRASLAMTHERRAPMDATFAANPSPQAYPLYSVDVVDIANGSSLVEAASPLGWRYLVVEDQRVSAADIADRAGVHELARWNYGRFNAQVAAALLRATGADELAGEHEPRLLTIPALCVLAVWLVSPETVGYVIPLSPSDPALDPNHVYPADEFVSALVPAAADRLSSPDPA